MKDSLDRIITGDAREAVKRIPDNSIDLIFTDPVYQNFEDYQWLAETAARVLKPDSALLCFFGIGYLPETIAALCVNGLTYRWQGLWYQSNNNKQRGGFGFVVYSPFLWYEKGRCKIYKKTNDVANVPIPNDKHNHKWSKQPNAIKRYIEATTKIGAIIYDPFTGGGTIPAVCKMLDRHFIANEIDPATAEQARKRLENTQAPLPGINEMMQGALL